MADKKNEIDPLAPWRDMVSQWEKNVNALANKTMASDEYSRSMHGAMSTTLKMQEAMRDAMASYLASANLPSRTEVLAIAERVGGVEARLDRMNALLERIAAAGDGGKGEAPPPRAPRPPRTKSPPAAES
jgi:Poly(R)-hydroxyalkanoic acid synthase subunit (PHA_synth_III_E)